MYIFISIFSRTKLNINQIVHLHVCFLAFVLTIVKITKIENNKNILLFWKYIFSLRNFQIGATVHAPKSICFKTPGLRKQQTLVVQRSW